MYALHRAFDPVFYLAPRVPIPAISCSQMGLKRGANNGHHTVHHPSRYILRSSEFAFGESMQYLHWFVLHDREPANP
jgi:hypothetical protein